jgi:excisionase family DNA binding protein
VHLKVNRPSSSDSGLVIEPAISGNNDVMAVVLGTKGNPLGFDLEAVPLEQFPQGNVAQVGRNAVFASLVFSLVFCHPLVPAHGCHDVPEQTGPCPQFRATLSRYDLRNCPGSGTEGRDFGLQSRLKLMQAKTHRRRFRSEPSASFNADSAYRALQRRMASEPATKAENQEFICAKEAAAWLGVPLRSLHQYVQQGLLPSYKLGRHRLFRKGELLAALGAHRLTTRSAILR